MKNLFLIAISLLIISIEVAHSQPQKGTLIDIKVYPSSGNYDFQVGDKIDFEVLVYKYGMPVEDGEISYRIGPEKFEGEEFSMKIKNGKAVIRGGLMDQPGFYRCFVYFHFEGKKYQNSTTVSFNKELIKPTTTKPDDFDTFWSNNLAEVADIPLEPTMVPMPVKDNEYANFYHVSFRVDAQSRFYGILSVPKKEGKYPAKLTVPGAGVRAYHGSDFALDKVINLTIGIHGIPVNLYESSLYEDLRLGALNGYVGYNLDDKDKYYYKRVYLGCKRAVDFIHSLPSFDGETVAVSGGSQGGALAIVTASLDPRVDYLVSYFPALSDLTGFLQGRAGGWPHFFTEGEGSKQKIETTKYYDVVNFARSIDISGFYSYGYNDNVCPPTSINAVLNVIEAEKEIVIPYDVGHFNYPEVWKKTDDWLMSKLLK